MPYIPLFILKHFLRRVKSRANVSNPQAARRGFERITGKWNTPLSGFTYQPIEAAGIHAEWIYPEGCDKTKVLLYFHGGGYFTGSYNTHRALVSKLAQNAGISALNINYRLAPEHPYPAAIEDCASVYQWLLAQGFSSVNICFGGDSAGGGCTIGTLTYLRDKGIPLPKCAIAISPWLDHTFAGDSFPHKDAVDPMLLASAFPDVSKYYMGDSDANSPYASPLFHSLAGLPPVLVQVGEDELLLSDSVRFAEKAKADGSDVMLEVYPGMFHVFNAFWRVMPKARLANKKLGEFMRKQLYNK
ncbi:MAG TPA: alpha/beta hydrolase [Chitinophagales bacterium]|nr:alpha/beta hydrolase [Chitinophagales bacterium]